MVTMINKSDRKKIKAVCISMDSSTENEEINAIASAAIFNLLSVFTLWKTYESVSAVLFYENN